MIKNDFVPTTISLPQKKSQTRNQSNLRFFFIA